MARSRTYNYEEQLNESNVNVSWPRIQGAFNITFKEFASFDKDIAVCGELTEAEILTTVGLMQDQR